MESYKPSYSIYYTSNTRIVTVSHGLYIFKIIIFSYSIVGTRFISLLCFFFFPVAKKCMFEMEISSQPLAKWLLASLKFIVQESNTDFCTLKKMSRD